jgi:hypothetical protein
LTANVELREPQGLDWLRRQHDQLTALENLKTIKDRLATEADAIERQLRNETSLPASFITDCVAKRGVARQRALRLAERKLTGAVINGSVDLLDIRWLAPHDHLIAQPTHPNEYQSNITTHICLIWPDRTGAFTVWSRWLLEVSTNALGRFMQYSQGADLRGALFEAAAAYVAADANDIFAHPISLHLRAGPGVFVGDLIHGVIEHSNNSCLYVRAGTWLADAMLGKRQPLLRAQKPEDSIATLLLRQARSKDYPRFETTGRDHLAGVLQQQPKAFGSSFLLGSAGGR